MVGGERFQLLASRFQTERDKQATLTPGGGAGGILTHGLHRDRMAGTDRRPYSTLAGRAGLEPALTGSRPAVLPFALSAKHFLHGFARHCPSDSFSPPQAGHVVSSWRQLSWNIAFDS